MELSTLVNSVAISKHLKVAVRENVHKEAAFLHALCPCYHGNSSLCGYQGLVVNEGKMRKRKSLKAFVSLAFEVFYLSETFISYLRLFTPL